MLAAGGRRHSARPALRTQCGPPTKTKVVVIRRHPGLARQAQRHFAQALTLHRAMARAPAQKAPVSVELRRRQRQASAAAAAAQFYQAEQRLESFLALRFPADLDFTRRGRRRAEGRFMSYLTRKTARLEQARAAYQQVIKARVPHWAIAASARVGQLFQSFADALYTAPVPRPDIPRVLVSRQDRREYLQLFYDAYCDRLEVVARPLEQKAEQGLAICLRKSTQLSWYNEWSRLCEAELNQIKPSTYHLAAEIRARPSYVRARNQRVALLRSIR